MIIRTAVDRIRAICMYNQPFEYILPFSIFLAHRLVMYRTPRKTITYGMR
jgi:hypothetical protein